MASYRTRPDEHARLGVHRVHCSSTSEPGRLSVQVLRTARSIVMIDWLDELLSFSLPHSPRLAILLVGILQGQLPLPSPAVALSKPYAVQSEANRIIDHIHCLIRSTSMDQLVVGVARPSSPSAAAHVAYKIPAGDGPYARAKHYQVYISSVFSRRRSWLAPPRPWGNYSSLYICIYLYISRCFIRLGN